VVIVVTELDRPSWLLYGVYASTSYTERRVAWKEASALINQDIPTVVAGDFNTIERKEDKRGGRPFI